MATLKSETGGDSFGSFGTGAYIMIGLWVGLVAMHTLAHLLGTELPISDAPWLRLAGRMFFGAIGFAAIHLIGAALCTFLRVIGRTILAGLTVTISAGERLGARAADGAIRGLMFVAALSLLPLTMTSRALHARVIAPWLERRRQQAELRRLYADVKDQYAGFDEFLRAFNAGSRESADAQEGSRAGPSPGDPFASAAALFGLAADGSFTKAEFKTAYRRRMKEVHPDLAGDTALATRLNEARDLINARKGWKR
jgi:hypothetical protein